MYLQHGNVKNRFKIKSSFSAALAIFCTWGVEAVNVNRYIAVATINIV